MSESAHQHVPPGTLRAYRHGRTDPAETLAVSDALTACADCRAAMAALPPAPTYEEIADAADLGLDPAASPAFADDPAARAELDDLLAFRREMAGQEDRTFGPVPVQGRGGASGNIVPLPRPFWTRQSFPALLAAAATLALLAGGWWMFAPSRDDGARQLLTDGQGHTAVLAALPADLRAAVQSTLRNGRLPTAPALAGLRPPTGTLAGTADATGFRAVAPVGVVAREAQPTLRWVARTGAERHRVIVVDTETGADSSAELPADATRWTTPALVPGRIYEWQVEAIAGGETIDRAPKPPAPEARFRVLGEAERAELAQVEARYGQYPLVLATAYARAGLVEEEAAALDRLAREHPRSRLAQQLRAAALARRPSR